MNDRFKFRAWNYIVKRFQYFNFKELNEFKEPIQWHILTFQQCTGLKDKNGKFIYECDIVESTKIWDDDSESITRNIIEDIRDIPRELFFGSYKGHNKIIGNIYENPELMEVNQ